MRPKDPTPQVLALVLLIDAPFAALAPVALDRLLALPASAARAFFILAASAYLLKTALYAGGLWWLLRPVRRWVRVDPEAPEHAERVAAAHAAAARTPPRASLLFALLWAAAYPGAAYLLQDLRPGTRFLGPHEAVAAGLFAAALMLGTFVASYAVHTWRLSPVMASISRAAPVERCLQLPGTESPLRARVVVLLLCASLGPSAWMASFGYLSYVRSLADMGQRQARAISNAVASELREGPETEQDLAALVAQHRTERVAPFIATVEGEFLAGETALPPRRQRAIQTQVRSMDPSRRRASWSQLDMFRIVAVQRVGDRYVAGAAVRVTPPSAIIVTEAAVVFTLILVFWAGVTAAFLSGALAKELLGIRDVVAAVGRNRRVRGAERAPLYDHQELGTLAQGVNEMLGQLEKSEAIAAEMEQFKQEFIRVAAHELKTPVATLKGYAQILASSSDPELPARAALAINRGAQRMERIVSELLDISQLRIGSAEMQTKPVDLGSLVDRVRTRVARKLGRPIDLRCNASVVVEADAAWLGKLLEFLLDNAAAYSPEDTMIEVTIDLEDGWAILSVEDYGVGIPPDKGALLFQPFRRAHTDTPYDRGGFGVSLYLCRLIIERHGGRIWFESEEGRGTTFFVSLPSASEAMDGRKSTRA